MEMATELSKIIVSYICNNCTLKPFDCERKNWCEDNFARNCKRPPRIGIDTTCPLMQFKAVEDADERPWPERPKDGSFAVSIPIGDTWLLCELCKYSECDGKYVSIENCFEAHCVDCPVRDIRDAITETEAEAAMS